MGSRLEFYNQPGSSLVVQLIKTLPGMRESWVQSLVWEDPLENSMDYIVHGVAKSQARLRNFHFHFQPALCIS